MNIFTVSFFGHRQIDSPIAIERKLEKLIRDLLITKEYVEFLLGRDGEFDLLVASTIHRCRRTVRDDNSALVLVLPYILAECRNTAAPFNDYYDEVEICTASSLVHFKAAHQSRNRAIVDRSDLAVFCVQHPSGGAYQTMRYAAKAEIICVNLADLDEEQLQHNKLRGNLC